MHFDQNITKGSGVRTPPPFLFAFFVFAGLILQKFYFLDMEIFRSLYSKIIGIFLVSLALLFLFKGFSIFIQIKTTILFSQPASALITTGIFSITRNPIYVGFSFGYFGFVCLMGNWWHLILFPILF